MRNKILQLLYLFMIGALSIMLPCCTKENNGGNNNSGSNNGSDVVFPWEEYTPTSTDKVLTNKLKNTSWTFVKYVSSEYGIIRTAQDIITSCINNEDSHYYLDISYSEDHIIYADGIRKGIWWIQEGSLIQKWGNQIGIINSLGIDTDPYDTGRLISMHNWISNRDDIYFPPITITKLTNDELVHEGGVCKQTTYYTKNTGGGGGGGNSSYELPDIGLMDYDAWSNSIKVVYKIFNKEESQVSSAKVYYGTSNNPTSSVTATISGVLITARITGLTSGTKYYVKCAATGPAGTTTTPTTGIITFTP